MTRTMVRTFNLCAICFIVLVVGAFIAPGTSQADEIKISPHVINLTSAGYYVTIHTDIPFSSEDVCADFALWINNAYCLDNNVKIFPSSCYADDRGYFVAKFDLDDINHLSPIIGEVNTFELSSEVFDFQATEDIKVIMCPGR